MEDLERVRNRYAGRALQEWHRLEATPITRIEYLITCDCLNRHLPPSGLVLDAGSGPGRYARDLARRGYDVIMHDLVREMLTLGQEKLAEPGIRERVGALIEGDLVALPYGDNVFDAVISLGAPLSHILDFERRQHAVIEMARVTKPGCPVFLTACTRLGAYRSAIYWLNLADFDQIMREPHRTHGVYDGSQLWYNFAPGELRALARRAALEVVDEVGCEGLASHLPLAHLAQIEADPERWPRWREVLLETCNDSSVVGFSNHVLVIAYKSSA